MTAPLHDDDPRLTAYALGGLPDDEVAAVEAHLRDHPSARRFVDATREAAAQLERAFAALPAEGALDPSQRERIVAQAAGPQRQGKVLRLTPRALPPVPWTAGVAAAAAALLVGVVFSNRDAIGRAITGDREFARGAASAREARAGSGGRGGPRGTAAPKPLVPQARDERREAAADPPRGLDGSRGTAIDGDVDGVEETVVVDRVSVPGRTAGDAAAPAAAAPPSRPGGATAAESAKVPGQEFGIGGGTGGRGGLNGGGGGPGSPDGRGKADPATLGTWGPGLGGSPFRQGATPAAPPVPVDRTMFLAQSSEAPADAVERLRVLVDTLALPEVRLESAADPARRLRALDARTTVATVRLALSEADAGRLLLDADARSTLEGYVRDRLGSAGKDSPENYAELRDNDFTRVADAPLSTFGTDVDTASYSNVRRFLNGGRLPPPSAVRIEELVNYFPYAYAAPTDGEAFAVHADVAGCPWKSGNRLVRIALKGREVAFDRRPAANLVFLIDVSGSMRPENKLPLLVRSLKLLVEKLDEGDRVAIVVYAGASGLALPSTPGDRKGEILAALDRLQAGGSTNGGAGIELAYATAAENFVAGGVNRVILATDGDFNVGVSDEGSLARLIEEKAKSKVFLSVLGFGEGNLQDAKMEKLADRGNGNYAYVDTIDEGRKVLDAQAAGTLITIAKDLKVQVEFNPLRVASYRLIGYENRVLAAQDFADDRKDAGDLGAGHTVTALYEIVPAASAPVTATEPLRYQTPPAPSPNASSGELLTVKLRWKAPEGDVSTLRERPVTDAGASYAAASPDFKFAASVAAFGMLLRNSPHRGDATYDAVLELATEGLAHDPDGWRAQFLDLVRAAKTLTAR